MEASVPAFTPLVVSTPADEAARARLAAHLRIMQRHRVIRAWRHAWYPPGADDFQVGQADDLRISRLVIVLVSAAFLEAIHGREDDLRAALARHEAGEAWVIPIILDACGWRSSLFGGLTTVPSGGEPVSHGPCDNANWADVIRGLRAAAAFACRPPVLRGGCFGPPILEREPSLDPAQLERVLVRAQERKGRLCGPARLLPRESGSRLVGREHEILTVLDRLGSGGAILSGRGGLGKTVLSQRIALELAAHHDLLVAIDLMGASATPLSPVDAMAQVMCALAPDSTLPRVPGDFTKQYRNVLTGKRALLILDDARDGDQVEPLLQATPVMALITSRRSFDHSDLGAVALQELRPEAAVSIIRTGAPRVAEPAAREIARCYEHLPLALCIATTALTEAELEVTSYVEALRTAQRVTASPDPVATAIRLSLACVPAPLANLWSRLGVFVGDFESEAAAAVAGGDPSAIGPALEELARRGLLEEEPAAARYRQHEGARVVALASLNAEERYSAERRRAEHFRNKLCKTKDPGRHVWPREWVNIRAAQAWASEHAATDEAAAALALDFPLVCGMWPWLNQRSMWIAWIEGAFAAATRLGLEEHVRFLQDTFSPAMSYCQPPSIEYQEHRLTIAEKTGDGHAMAMALGALGGMYLTAHDYERAAAICERCVSVSHAIGERGWEVAALDRLGVCLLGLRDESGAIDRFEQAATVAREIGDFQGEARALSRLGHMYVARRDPRGIAAYERFLEIAREKPLVASDVHALQLLGDARIALGERQRGLELHEQAVARAREMGSEPAVWAALDALTQAYVRLGEADRAIQIQEQILARARELRDRIAEGAALDALGKIYLASGDVRRAVEHHEQALEIAEAMPKNRGSVRRKAPWLWSAGLAYEKHGDLPRAVEVMQSFIALMRALGRGDVMGSCEAHVGALVTRLKARQVDQEN